VRNKKSRFCTPSVFEPKIWVFYGKIKQNWEVQTNSRIYAKCLKINKLFSNLYLFLRPQIQEAVSKTDKFDKIGGFKSVSRIKIFEQCYSRKERNIASSIR
jgi:predicted metalloprotease